MTPTKQDQRISKYSPELQTWFPPLWEDHRTLRDFYENLLSFGNTQDEVPFIVKLVENPKFSFLGIFHGRVTLQQHDLIHILLGRGTTIIDEAFVLGFTMGTTHSVTSLEPMLFRLVNKFLYPREYRFNEIAERVFCDAINLGALSACQPLDQADLLPMLDCSLREIREKLGLERKLIEAYLEIEAKRYPNSKASKRMVDHQIRGSTNKIDELTGESALKSERRVD